MSKKFVRIFAFVLCIVTLMLSVSAVAFADDTENVCKKNCASYASRITKSYTVTSSWPFYAKDQFTIYKDNNGAIIGYNVVQIKKDCRPMVKLEGKSIKVNYHCKDYLLITSTWSLGFGWSKVSYDLTNRTFYYKLTKYGNISRI